MAGLNLRWLRRLADREGPAFVQGAERIDYPTFLEAIAAYRRGLRNAFPRPQRLVMPFVSSWAYVALLMALLEEGRAVLLYPPAEPLTDDVRTDFMPHALVYLTRDGRLQVFPLHPEAEGRPPRRALIFLTGGTGGRPRPAVFDPDPFLAQYVFPWKPALLTLPLMPLFHFGGFDLMMRTLGRGGAVKLVESIDVDTAHEALTRPPVPHSVSATPSFWRWLLMAYPEAQYRGVRRVNTGGEAPWPGLLEALRKHFPDAEVHNTWAGTEVGMIVPERIKIKGDMVWARPQPGFLGYWGRPLQLDDEGYFPTGDRGKWGPDGRVVFEGRADDVVKVQGHAVSLARVEAAILTHPAVTWARVKAHQHPMMGTYLEAHVAPIRSDGLTVADLRAFLQKHLLSYEVPARIRIAAAPELRPNLKK